MLACVVARERRLMKVSWLVTRPRLHFDSLESILGVIGLSASEMMNKLITIYFVDLMFNFDRESFSFVLLLLRARSDCSWNRIS